MVCTHHVDEEQESTFCGARQKLTTRLAGMKVVRVLLPLPVRVQVEIPHCFVGVIVVVSKHIGSHDQYPMILCHVHWEQ